MNKSDYKVYEDKMKKSIDSVAADFAAVRAGRASAAVLDRIMVDYYGTPTPIHQIASISSPDPRTLAIQPWDAAAADCNGDPLPREIRLLGQQSLQLLAQDTLRLGETILKEGLPHADHGRKR